MKSLLLATALAASAPAQAAFAIPGFELVYTTPAETTLLNPDLRDSSAVWRELFDGARREIVIGQYYAASRAGTPFEKVLERLEAAGRRGVTIRFLLDRRGIGISEPDTLARLRAIPNLELRIIDFGKLTGTGIHHAKYLVVDGKAAFVGSQNFDWRAFTHIQETGLLITEPRMVGQLQAVFEQDWRAQALIAQGQPVPANRPKPATAGAAQLVASPAAWNPPGVADSEAALLQLLADAQREIRVQMLDYAPLGYGPNGTRPYYGAIDSALRAAASRGVQVRLMVSHWNLEQPMLAWLKSLALAPNVQIRVVTVPQASGGFIPYARVIHTKAMTIDGRLAWLGTSNWAGGYFDKSRNLEVVLRSAAMAERLAALHEQAWSSAYAQPLDVNKNYPKPNKGSHQPPAGTLLPEG